MKAAVLLTIALAAVLVSAAVGYRAAPDRPHGIGQGWRDVCAAVPDDVRPVAWSFTRPDGGRAASGVCP